MIQGMNCGGRGLGSQRGMPEEPNGSGEGCSVDGSPLPRKTVNRGAPVLVGSHRCFV